MNDRRINELVRMAMEVEELESDVAAPQLRLVGDGVPAGDLSRSQRGWWAGATGIGLAAAAGLALVFAIPAMRHPEPASGTKNIATVPMPEQPTTTGIQIVRHLDLKQATQPVAPGPSVLPVIAQVQDRTDPGMVERCMVMAIYRGQRGQMHCVQVSPHEWSENKCLNEVTPQELKCVSVGQSCSASADHALVVAMSGPQKSLPRTESDAVNLATCILGSPCQNDSKCYSLSAAECLPVGVSVKIETIADSR